MAKGGYRPGAGRPKGARNVGSATSGGDIVKDAKSSGMSPLEYMLSVMNSEDVDPTRRDRMAIAAAPFVHAKADVAVGGKKQQRQANAEKSASGGRFAAPSAPKLVVSN